MIDPRQRAARGDAPPGGVRQEYAAAQPGPLWAKVTGQAAGTNRYAWEQIDDGDTAAFDVGLSAEFAATGTSAVEGAPAYEINGLTTVPTGTRVRLHPAGDLTYYVFEYAPPGGSVSAWKEPVRVATTASGTLATSFASGQILDGVTLATGDRILVKNQAAPAENGIYVVAASGAPARAADADTGAELLGAIVAVTNGTVNADTVWLCTANATITLGSTALPWVLLPGRNNDGTADGAGGVVDAPGSLAGWNDSGVRVRSVPAFVKSVSGASANGDSTGPMLKVTATPGSTGTPLTADGIELFRGTAPSVPGVDQRAGVRAVYDTTPSAITFGWLDFSLSGNTGDATGFLKVGGATHSATLLVSVDDAGTTSQATFSDTTGDARLLADKLAAKTFQHYDPVGPVYTSGVSGNLKAGATIKGGIVTNLGGVAGTYTTANVTTDRSFDANATTLDELADVLGTLIEDLKTWGILG